ncbi:MAG: L-2-hydroxyglutarate oxidase [Saprospiraceae bacterium]|nr:L-2-hydroxyglutarate oxidase [Saprospiraceae bacterium]
MTVDVIIIGAGIVGLATAFRLSELQPGLRITLIDKEEGPAQHQTGHNSGVIHSGIYYKPGGSKAVHCSQGYKAMLAFCEKYDVPHEICGKVIVATRPEELPRLDEILEKGIANGLQGLQKLGPEATRELEPHVQALASIYVPQAGIVNYATVARAYLQQITQRGAQSVFGAKVLDIQLRPGEATVVTSRGDYRSRLVINCAGLYADKITAMTMPESQVRILPFRGEYYELNPDKQYLVRNLIYPVPNPNFPFLGVHYTRKIGGGIEAGPNAVLAFRREGYSRWDFHAPELAETLAFSGFRKIAARYWRDGLGEMYRSFSKAAFVKALQHLIPEVGESDLHRGGAGVRAMACDPQGNLIDDFLFLEKQQVINVCNAPSPAATASLAIGETVARKAMLHM